MKKLFFVVAALLFLSGNSAVFGDIVTGEVSQSKDYYNHIINSQGKKIILKFDEPTELKSGQKIEAKGTLENDNKMRVQKVVVISDKVSW